MSVPHLDTRLVEGETALLFGPYAGFTTKFLKTARASTSFSVRPHNMVPMLQVALKNIDLTVYLINQLLRRATRSWRPFATSCPRPDRDWERVIAGQRVQVIKRTRKGGVLQFGTEVIAAGDGTIAGLLGASPGASTAAPIMLDVLRAASPTAGTAGSPGSGDDPGHRSRAVGRSRRRESVHHRDREGARAHRVAPPLCGPWRGVIRTAGRVAATRRDIRTAGSEEARSAPPIPNAGRVGAKRRIETNGCRGAPHRSVAMPRSPRARRGIACALMSSDNSIHTARFCMTSAALHDVGALTPSCKSTHVVGTLRVQ